MKLLAKLKKTIGTNKQLFLGLAIGALIMLPTGVYVNTRNNSHQADQPNTTLETKADNDSTEAKSLDTITGQPAPTQSSNQSSAGSTSKPTNTNASNPTTSTSSQPTTSNTPEYVYEKPQCSNTLRTSAINALKQGYQTQANRKSIELGAWYSNNYQLPTYTHQQFVDREAENQAWLDNYIAIEIANKNTSLNEYWVCTPITRSELGV